MVNATSWPLLTPGTHCIGGGVDPRAGLDGCGNCRPPTGIRSPDRPARIDDNNNNNKCKTAAVLVF